MKRLARAVAVLAAAALTLGAAPRGNPIADPHALKGGSINVYYGAFPKSFNYYLDNNTFTNLVYGLMYEPLIALHPANLEPSPDVAESWTISKDKKVFTFKIDPKARWSDGQPITAEDVAFTYDTIMDPRNLTSVTRVSLSRFEKPEILGPREIRFRAKTVHWENFIFFSGFFVLPKHVLQGQDFNKVNFDFPVVSGPYRLAQMNKGRDVILARRTDWWAADKPINRGMYNFDTIKFKTLQEQMAAFELFKKGEIDLFPVYISKRWHTETGGEKFQKNWIVKQRIFNESPASFQGFVMNMRRPLFQDVRVREAMALLINRPLMNQKLMYNEYFLLNSYIANAYPDRAAIKNPLTPYSPSKARALLKEAGWYKTDGDGWLVKDGKRFEFTFLMRDDSEEKFLTTYQEDLKALGIKMDLQLVSSSTWFKNMEKFDYDMTWASWQPSQFPDPEDTWYSKRADEPNSDNYPGYKNPEVDKLIAAQRTIFERARRDAIDRRIDKILYKSYSYALLWSIDNVRLLYWNKFGHPKTVLDKYDDESSAVSYWWYDPAKAARLRQAMAAGTALPAEPAAVRFPVHLR